VFCCTALSVSANRMLLQNQFRIQNSACDSCLIMTANICQLAVCLINCFAAIFGGGGVDPEVKNCVDCFFAMVMSCMQTQHHIEINHRGIGKVSAQAPPIPGSMMAAVPGGGPGYVHPANRGQGRVQGERAK
jgi:hypothetical protein